MLLYILHHMYIYLDNLNDIVRLHKNVDFFRIIKLVILLKVGICLFGYGWIVGGYCYRMMMGIVIDMMMFDELLIV